MAVIVHFVVWAVLERHCALRRTPGPVEIKVEIKKL
jgi:hypothetical protein